MKLAIVHDYIKEYGGAERVLEALHEIWPTSPVYTTVYLPEFLGPHKERFRDWNIKTSFLQYIPFKEKLISLFRIIAPFVFKTFDFSQFDIIIISATGAYIPNTIKLKTQNSKRKTTAQNSKLSQELKTNNQRPIHICYCHTPPRYLYGFATAREWKKNLIFRVLGEIANHFLRLVDFKSAQNVDYFIANSKNVAGRIKKFYRRDSIVVYPPVDTINFQKTQNTRRTRKSEKSESQRLRQSGSSDSPINRSSEFSEYSGKRKDYFLAGGRLARPKHIDLIVRVCRELRVPMKVFGKGFGGYDKLVQSSKFKVQSSSVEFVGEVSDEEKMELMRNARAYIFAAEDEDFGITPVEAMSVGTPVIAYRSGGVVESVIDGKTGIFYRFNDLNHLSEAVHKFEKMKFDKETIIKHAQKFSKERFKKEIKEFVEKSLVRG